jgi:Tfp pilus assembly protein PilV
MRYHSERGFSLMEAIIATLIAVIAIVGLAYSFGQGRALISSYQTSRAALAAAQGRMELLSVTPSSDPALALGPGNTPGLHSQPFLVNGRTLGTVRWAVTAFDDPANGVNAIDLKMVTVTVAWAGGFNPDSVSLSRLFPAQ